MTCKEKFESIYEGSPHDIKACPVDFKWGLGYPEYCCEGSDDDICEECWNREIPEQKKMTCLEKLAIEHPDKLLADGDAVGCPSHYGYLEDPSDMTCNLARCKDCWGREYPGYTIEDKANKEFLKEVESEEVLDKVCAVGNQNPIPPKELKKALGILDSGDRTKFETGAVRDMREGKGRCDLMPLEVVAKLMNEDICKPDLIVGSIALFKNSDDQNTVHLYNALLYFSQIRYCDYADMFLDVAKHFEEGAKKYGENNWQKGIPVYCYIDSAMRHYLKWRRGDKDESHDRAFVWNIMCCIWEVDFREKD